MSRWFRFILAILVGIGLGLLYGWFVSPVEMVDAKPEDLREDYKADYVLMVAEAYYADQNLDQALARLALLGGSSPAQVTRQAILFAERIGYSDADLALMQVLSNAVQAAAQSAAPNAAPNTAQDGAQTPPQPAGSLETPTP